MRLSKYILYCYVNIVLIFVGFVYLFCMSCVSADCTAGEYVEKEENKCKQCERGTYQSKPLQEKCDDCPLNKTTLGQGHRDEADCVSEYILMYSETTAIFRKNNKIYFYLKLIYRHNRSVI